MVPFIFLSISNNIQQTNSSKHFTKNSIEQYISNDTIYRFLHLKDNLRSINSGNFEVKISNNYMLFYKLTKTCSKWEINTTIEIDDNLYVKVVSGTVQPYDLKDILPNTLKL